MPPFRTVGLIGKYEDASIGTTVALLAAHLADRGVTVMIDADSHRYLPDQHYPCLPRADIAARCDLIVVIGGDGTLLNASRVVARHGVPIVGVNLGRLGFMVDVLPEQMNDIFDEILDGQYVVEERIMLESEVHRGARSLGKFHSVNDVVVRNMELLRILEFDSYMNGDFISHHRADGIIVATPTGSTAYALSGGGPVLYPTLDALALVPICPHTLSDRPIVVDGAMEIEVRLARGSAPPAVVTFDGQDNQPLTGEDRITVRRADIRLKLIHPKSYDYFNILRNKLHWGRGQRLPGATPVAPDDGKPEPC